MGKWEHPIYSEEEARQIISAFENPSNHSFFKMLNHIKKICIDNMEDDSLKRPPGSCLLSVGNTSAQDSFFKGGISIIEDILNKPAEFVPYWDALEKGEEENV